MNTVEQIFAIIDSARKRTIDDFRVGREAKAFESLTQYINHIQEGMNGSFKFLKLTLFTKILDEIFQAQKNEDYVRLADLLQYETPGSGLDPESVNISKIELTTNYSDAIIPGASIRFTATAFGGTGQFEYCYLLAIEDNEWSSVRGFSNDNSFQWKVPENISRYSIGVWVRCISCEEDPTGIKILEFSIK